MRGLGYPNLANILPSPSSQPLSRYRSTQGPRRWPMLLPVALESGLVFPSHRLFHACCACKSERVTTRLLYTQRNQHGEEAVLYVSRGRMQDTLKLCCWKQEKAVNILLPKLHHCTGEIGGVCDWVVCITFLCVPWIVTRAPWKFLWEKKNYSGFFYPSPPWHIYGF